MNSIELKDKLDIELKKGLISSRVLLDKLRVIENNSRLTSAYQDPRFIPFYYHLGKFLTPKNLVEIGCGLGFFTSCFAKSCKSIKKVLEFEQKTDTFHSSRLALANIRDTYKGDLDFYLGNAMDSEFITKLDEVKWDLAFVNDIESLDTHRIYLDLLWERMELDGFIVVEYLSRHAPAKDAFIGFCKIVNRKPVFFDTRYGTGIIQR